MIKYYNKVTKKIYDLLTFDNEENNLLVEVILILLVLGIFIFLFWFFGIDFLENPKTKSGFFNLFIALISVVLFVVSSYYYFFKPKQKKITNNELNIQNNNTSNFIFDETSSAETNESKINNKDKVEQNIPLFHTELKDKIYKTIKKMNITTKTDITILFLYIQKFILTQKISDAELLREIPSVFKLKLPTPSYFGQISNELFEWKDKDSKIKVVKNINDNASNYERFNEIKIIFDSLEPTK